MAACIWRDALSAASESVELLFVVRPVARRQALQVLQVDFGVARLARLVQFRLGVERCAGPAVAVHLRWLALSLLY